MTKIRQTAANRFFWTVGEKHAQSMHRTTFSLVFCIVISAAGICRSGLCHLVSGDKIIDSDRNLDSIVAETELGSDRDKNEEGIGVNLALEANTKTTKDLEYDNVGARSVSKTGL